MSIVSDIVKYTRLAWELRGFLRGTITLEQSKQVISARLRNRQNNFLNLVEKGIYQNRRSPYLKLLRAAGCEFGDIRAGVNRDGIEATLQKLLEAGVYLSWEEFKGKKEVVRGSSRFQFREREFDNPFLPNYYQTRSSGSRSAGTRTAFDLSHQLAMSYYCLPMLDVVHALDVPLGIWKSILPSTAGIGDVLRQYKAGKPVTRWFTPVNEKQVESSLRDRLATKYIIYGSRLWGAGLAKPEYVGFEEAGKVVRWIAARKEESGGCAFMCSPNSALRICRAAIENKLDIQGTHFIVGGEPLTSTKREQIEAAGATITPRYAISEIGRIGCGCAETKATDDIHLFHDSVALILNRRKVKHTDIDVDAFVFTTILSSAPKILLNIESDDFGFVENRDCGCLFGQMGFNQHLSNIRSFAKLTGIGMTIIGTDFVRILEEVLPKKYGGTATDYQLLEEEGELGQTHLNLIISPLVGRIDEDAVITTVLEELRKSAYGGKLAAGLWSQEKFLRIIRTSPISKMGKVMTLYLGKKK